MSKGIEEVRYWFEQALEVATRDRRAFLQGNCTDEAVRAEVLSLVQYEDAAVPQSVRSAIGTVLGGDAPPVRRVGAFELGRLLGSGGMGFVYEGHRADGAVRQRVAIKFAQVSPAASDRFRDSAHRRFARERQMLASLRHPYIAGLIDAGTTPEGIPYAVIEQVDGAPIDAYCDGALPHHGDRIRLFLKLCEAVQFAHRNLVVHSDIKPENILVTADGNPKLIDFGVASDLADEAANPTVRAFTPGYASPEQSLGLAPSVATDVYGLGAVLYRLLAGVAPRRLRSESLEDAIRQISEEEVLRPSAIRPELKGDIENILVKALQREPNRRYGSVPELAEDLKRYLARRPVTASPDSALYRCSRFVRRHWIPLGATAMLAAAMTMATGVSLHERREAMKRTAETRLLAEKLLFEVHDEIGNAVGGTRAKEKLGEIAVQYLEKLERGRHDDPELAWELMNAYARLAQSRGGAVSSVGDTKSAAQLASRALALGQVVENAAPDTDRLDKLFEAYVRLVPIFLDAGRRAEQRETVERLQRLAPRLRRLREAEAAKQLARFYDDADMPEQAVGVWARALSILRNLPDDPGTRSETVTNLVSTLAGYGRAQSVAGDFAGAISSVEEAIRLTQGRVVPARQAAKRARQLYWTYLVLGDTYGCPLRFSLGRPAEAVVQYRKARGVAEQLVDADPANDAAKLDLARAFSREGMALAASQPAAGLRLLDRARELVSQASPRNYSALDSQFAYLTASVPALVQLGRFDTANARISEARRLDRDLRREGVPVDERGLFKAEAILLYATGHQSEALQRAKQHLRLLPAATRPILSENYAAVELLERLRVYAAGLDAATCASASERLARTWADLRAAYPSWTGARAAADRAEANGWKGCETKIVARVPAARTPNPRVEPALLSRAAIR